MTDFSPKIRIGTRGSPLAMTQTHMVRDALLGVQSELQIEIVEILTSGDWKPEHGEVALRADAGGKALFAKEIEERLLGGDIDIAVHSMKDMDSTLPDGLVIDHMLPRAPVNDTLIINLLANNSQFDGVLPMLPEGAVVGTTSVRRQALLTALRPDLKFAPFRGNVHTRIQKCRDGQVDATLLALAGLTRLGIADEADAVLSLDDMIPCAGQGAVGVEMRSGDGGVARLLSLISCARTVMAVKAERAVLEHINGTCHTPIGIHAGFYNEVLPNELSLVIHVADLEGHYNMRLSDLCLVDDLDQAVAFGHRMGQKLVDQMPPALAQKILEVV